MIYLLCCILAALLGAGQLLFKLAANHLNSHFLEQGYWVLFSWPLISALILYALTTALWVYILTRLPLSVAYPFSLAGAGVVILLSHLVFAEVISAKQLIGLAMVIIGLLIANS